MAHGPRSKLGISWPVQEESSDPVAKFFEPGSKVSWHYNWNKNWVELLPKTTPGLQINGEFVPMIFAPSYLSNEYQLQSGWQLLLGYNEPDMNNPEVAVPVTPEEAAKAWVELAALRTEGKQLASPAVAGDIGWLKTFFANIPQGLKPDYLAIHVYQTTFEAFQREVEKYYKAFGLPIIVTEFAMQSFDPNVPPPQNMQQVHDYMGQTTKWLDETPWIARFAWFGACRDATNLHGVHPYNRLMDADGNLTALGQQYVAGGHA